MKLLSYGLDHRMEPRLAFSMRGQAVDVMRASLWMKEDRGAMDFLNLASSMKLALENWERSFSLLKELESAFFNIDFEGLSIYDRTLALSEHEIVFFAPVPDPPSLRYFQAFPQDDSSGFVFGNTQSLLGHQQALTHDHLSIRAELAAFLAVNRTGEYCRIAGYSIVNNWLDPALPDNQGLSQGQASSLGPYFVTADELESHKLGRGFSLELQVRINGQHVAEGRFRDMQIGFEEMIAMAQPTHLQAGDVFCSGTPVRSGQNIGSTRGDHIEVEIQVLGTLATDVV